MACSRLAVGAHQVVARLFGIGRDVPARLAARVDQIHLFAAEDGTRI